MAHETQGRRRRRPLAARWWFWVLLALLIQFVPWPAAWADAVFLRGTLPVWSAVVAPVTQASGRSISALLLLALLAVVLIGLVAGGRTRGAVGRSLGGVIALLALTFPFVFGLGYHTTPLATSLGASSLVAPSAEDEEAARQLVLSTLLVAADPSRQPEDAAPDGTPRPEGAGDRSELPVDPAADSQQPEDVATAAAACIEAFLPRVDRDPLPTVPDRVKAVPSGWLLRLGFSGVISPWLLEPHVDPALPAPELTSVALHELAHTAGYAREAEAEAVGMLAGLGCEDQRVRYAAALRAATALAGDLPEAEREAFLAQWPAVALDDARAASAVARSFRSAAADIASRVYDAYLVGQGGEGMSDYDRGIDLVVLALTNGD